MKQLLILFSLLLAFSHSSRAQEVPTKKTSVKKLTRIIKGDWILQMPGGNSPQTTIVSFKPDGILQMVANEDGSEASLTKSGKWKVVEAGVVLFYDSSSGIPDEKMGIELVNKNTVVMSSTKGPKERKVTLVRTKKSKK